MKKIILSLSITLLILSNTSLSQTNNFPIWSGLWTESQSCNSSIQWLFGKGQSFAKTQLWGNNGPGGIYNAGTYKLDLENKTLTINYSTNINLTYQKVSPSDGAETFSIVKESESELIFSRPLRKGEKPNNVSDDKNLYITLVRLTTNHGRETAMNN